MPITINGSSGIVGANGSVTFPALTGADIDTGVFFPEANVVAFSVNSTESFRANANGIFATANVNVTNLTATNIVPSSSYLRNRIINGDMRIDQRNAGAQITAANLTTGAYMVDRWLYLSSQAAKFTAQQNAAAVTSAVGFPNYLGMTVASAVTVGASDYFAIQQFIEGFNFADLAWGTASAKTVTLSFVVYSSLTGTFGGSLRNSTATRSYPFTYSIPTANTWTTISVTIAGDTSGTWVGATNGTGVQVGFGLGVGTTYSGTAGAWSATNYVTATGAVSVVGTSGATFYITGVQLEVGSVATPFERQIYGTQLLQCQRYFQTVVDMMVQGYQGTGATLYNDFPLIVPMRTAPTGAYTGSFSYINASAAAVNSTTANKYRLSLVVTTTGYGAGYGNPITFAAEL